MEDPKQKNSKRHYVVGAVVILFSVLLFIFVALVRFFTVSSDPVDLNDTVAVVSTTVVSEYGLDSDTTTVRGVVPQSSESTTQSVTQSTSYLPVVSSTPSLDADAFLKQSRDVVRSAILGIFDYLGSDFNPTLARGTLAIPSSFEVAKYFVPLVEEEIDGYMITKDVALDLALTLNRTYGATGVLLTDNGPSDSTKPPEKREPTGASRNQLYLLEGDIDSTLEGFSPSESYGTLRSVFRYTVGGFVYDVILDVDVTFDGLISGFNTQYIAEVSRPNS